MSTARIEEYITKGAKDKLWYEDCARLFNYCFGAQRLSLIASLFAATSINSSLKSNIRLFRRALYELDNGLPVGNYVPVMKLQLERIRKGEPIQGRKISSFAAAIAGDVNAVVVDIWLLRAFEMNRQYARKGVLRESGATDRQYTIIEGYCRELAVAQGLEPRQVSAMLWSGCRSTVSKEKETSYKNILLHQLYNMYEQRSS